jgi:hypothetical protein
LASPSIIFGDHRVSAEQIRKVMNVTFPQQLLTVVLQQIVVNAPPDTRETFATAGEPARGIGVSFCKDRCVRASLYNSTT